MERDISKGFAISGTGAASEHMPDGEPEDFEHRVRMLKKLSEARERAMAAEREEREIADDE